MLSLLDQAGVPAATFHGAGSRATVAGIEFIEMRPRDAGTWLAAGRIAGAFISTDIILEVAKLRELGASGIVALRPAALLPS